MTALRLLFFVALFYQIQSEEIRVCGTSLSQLLHSVCVNGYNGKILNKKSSDQPAMNLREFFKDEGPSQPDSLLMQIFSIHSSNTAAKTRRDYGYTGVYDECCRKACSLEELVSYCI
uniref:Insulin-like domain-containing protein n=1 Tax=Stomoxys calcitrans TaxID=35570 RepID=A0A1I8NW14_STOCA